MINRHEPSGEKGPTITEMEIALWNNNTAKTTKVEDEVEKLKREFASINPEQLRQDITNINQKIILFAEKSDLTAL